MFSTYFGGSTFDWATPIETFTYYANFTLDSANQIPPDTTDNFQAPIECDCSMCLGNENDDMCSGVSVLSFTVDNIWNTGYSANLTVNNQMDSDVDGWIVSFKLASGVTLNKLWRGELLKSNEDTGEYTIMSTSSSASVPVGDLNNIRFTSQHPSTADGNQPTQGYAQLSDLAFQALEWSNPISCKDINGVFPSSPDAVSESLFDCFCGDDESPDANACDPSVDIVIDIMPASDHDGVILGVPSIVNNGAGSVSLNGLSIPISFNGRVMSPEGEWYTASPEDFVLSCWNGYVKIQGEAVRNDNV